MSTAFRPAAADRPTTLVDRARDRPARASRALPGGGRAGRPPAPRPVLLLVHGITSRADGWRPIMELLARDHHVLAPDLLGHGGSAKPRGDYSLGAYASGLRDLVAALGHDRVSVAGPLPRRRRGDAVRLPVPRAHRAPGAHQQRRPGARGQRPAAGGGAARRRARAAPPDARLAARRHGLARARRDARRHPRRPRPGRGRPRLPLARATRRRGRRSCTRCGPSSTPPASASAATTASTWRPTCPTLVVWGERDPIIPVAHGREAHAAMPGSRLEVFAGAGHFPYLDDPVRFGVRPARVAHRHGRPPSSSRRRCASGCWPARRPAPPRTLPPP